MANPGVYQLFVYGSLRSGFRSPVYEYISRFFTFVGEARVRGKLYDLGEYPAALPVQEDSFIIGELYIIKQEDEFSWAIGQLDDYEGVNIEVGEEKLYYRELADVLLNDTVTRAWIYWFKGDVSGQPLITSGDLIQYMGEKNK
jgi:gamma-glutamylcyclotransferase (GGCT)/AIG2-like uncharacterized protein YtfP